MSQRAGGIREKVSVGMRILPLVSGAELILFCLGNASLQENIHPFEA